MLKVVLALALGVAVNAECPNACSGHGSCSKFDMCLCYNNYQGNDCSQKTCPFGTAHVDSPKGDLDGSFGALSGPDDNLIAGSTVYPAGTTEQYPNMVDSDGSTLDNTAHYYMECSNKGLCDRKVGECECFDGYEGSACQRASCPEGCSGHGTCETIAELAEDEYANIYALWDADLTMGCKCDAGYTGSDCSSRSCPHGIDPLYVDDESTARVSTATYKLAVDTGTTMTGTYAIKFYDVFGEDWVTDPIVATESTDCQSVVDTLESLPNTVVPDGSVMCSSPGATGTTSGSDLTELEYSLTFTGNPGYLKPIVIDKFLDGTRATLDDVIASVYTDGMSGEFVDYFATQCAGVYVKGSFTEGAQEVNHASVLGSITSAETKLLKKCLGDSDGVSSNNVEVYDWDYGATDTTGPYMGGNPHIIKLVKKTPNDDYDGGKFYVTWWKALTDEFVLGNEIEDTSEEYAVFTTDGVAERVFLDTNGDGIMSQAFGRNESRVYAHFDQYSSLIYTSVDVSCETGNSTVEPCLERGDKLFVFDAAWGKAAPVGTNDPDSTVNSNTGDMFTIAKIWKEEETATTESTSEDKYRIQLDAAINWDGSTLGDPDGDGVSDTGYVQLIKFTPATTGNFEFVSTCSNRGLCNGDDGLCECFKGYTGADCATQSALAI